MILAQFLLDIIFPPICFACEAHLKTENEKKIGVCAACSGKLGYLPGFLCPVCFKRLPAVASAKAGLPVNICHEESRFILAAPLRYSNPAARGIIQTLKYKKIEAAADPLVSILAEYLSVSLLNSLNAVIIPVPIHWKKERKRGFNQAFVIARGLKNRMEIFRETPIISGALVKIADKPSQTKQKDYKAREENIRGSFEIRKPEQISGKNVFLVDDVFTSGATMREAVRILKLAGAKKIIAVVIAKA